MKKTILDFQKKSLSKSEMKALVGGSNSCSSGPCRLYISKTDGTWGYRNGTCDGYTESGSNKLTCFCNAGVMAKHLSSNGGVSRCTN